MELPMTGVTLTEKLESCIQRLAGEVLREVEGLTEDEKNVHYLCRSIENLVRVYAEGGMPPQKRLAHERLNRYLHRLREIPARAAAGSRVLPVSIRAVAGQGEAHAGIPAESSSSLARSERRMKRRPIFR
jgi:hypothetical protein